MVANTAVALHRGDVNKFPGGRVSLRVVEHGKFLNEKVFRPICLFKVRGASNKGQMVKWGVVEKRSRATEIQEVHKKREYIFV